MKKTLIAGGIATLAVGGMVIHHFGATSAITLNTTTAKHVQWNKPTTDAGWAEDVKAEQLNYRGTEVLKEMVASQIAKLEKEIEANKKYQECAECIYYDYYEQFKTNMDDVTAKNEARTAADTAIAQHQWEVEKITQSIERINHELDLRKKGFVVTDEQPISAPLFGGTKPASRVRHIVK